MANIEMGDTPNITAAERFLFLSALGLGAPYYAGSFSDTTNIALDYEDGPCQKIQFGSIGGATSGTITIANGTDGAMLTIYIDSRSDTYTLGFDAAMPGESLAAFPRLLGQGTYVAKLCHIPLCGWCLVSFVGMYEHTPF